MEAREARDASQVVTPLELRGGEARPTAGCDARVGQRRRIQRVESVLRCEEALAHPAVQGVVRGDAQHERRGAKHKAHALDGRALLCGKHLGVAAQLEHLRRPRMAP